MSLLSKAVSFSKDVKVRILTILVVVSIIFVSVTNVYSEPIKTTSNYSSMGTVVSISSTDLALSVKGSTNTFDIDAVSKIQSKSYAQLSINDVKVGDAVIVQGINDTGKVIIRRIIDMTWTVERGLATSTPQQSIVPDSASTTVAATTSMTDMTASSTNGDSLELGANESTSTSVRIDLAASSTPLATDSATSTADVATTTSAVTVDTAGTVPTNADTTASSTPDSTAPAESSQTNQ
ncbi:MAG TPA: hypothetical protein VL335_00025 [Candidatus Paceibacterota bacterium]|jgi:hypothetical protein|nr:hypothetical protein [Candidatus Paceibacterota bacterium]